jgi:prepilin peptidase dependent protein B
MMKISKQRGLSLIELMVGLVVSLIVLGGSISAFLLLSRSSGENMRANKLNHDVQLVLDVMAAEIRRIGYWNSEGASAPANNPLTFPNLRDYNIINSAGTVINSNNGTVAGTCILFAYDEDGSGSFASGEYGGFKLEGQEIWMRKTGTSLTDCNISGEWERVTYSQIIEVTRLEFSNIVRATGVSAPFAENRVIRIALEAQATGDSSITKRLTDTGTANTLVNIRIRNNRMIDS